MQKLYVLRMDLWMTHCSYLRSGGEKNIELLEICIIYSVFFSFILSHWVVQNYGKEKKEQHEDGRSRQPVTKHNL
jgi:hypothetical protein